MTSVTFPTLLGGDGSTVTDDSNATTGLGNGGHRYRFLPSLVNTVAMAQTAFNAANAAVTSPGSMTATSTSSVTVGTGTKSLTLTQTGKGFNVGGYVVIAATLAPSTYMYGQITAFTAGTGAMTVNVLSVGGSGTLTNWTISAAQPNFAIYSPSTGTLGLYFDGTNFGVGNATPNLRLVVTAAAAGNIARFNTVGTSGYIEIGNSGGVTGYIGSASGINGAGGNNALGIRSENELSFATGGGNERMRIDATGQVLPTLNNTYNLGSATFKWGTVYATTFNGNLTGNVTGNVTGNADTVTNGVYTTGAQTVAGVKTFSNQPVLSAGAQFPDTTAQNTAFVGRKAQTFTANGTFTIPAGITALKVTLVGGGGGSGGAFGIVCTAGATSGGGGGGTCISYLTSLTPGATISVTIGGAGTAGAASGTAGGAGGNSTLTSGTQSITTVTAGGGGGSAGSTGGTSFLAGGASGSATNGTINIPGQKGQTSPSSTVGGTGGSSQMGFGGTSDGIIVAGTAGVGYGAGASGAAEGGASRAGAAGTAGIVIFEW